MIITFYVFTTTPDAPESRSHWGKHLRSGQMRLPWNDWETNNKEIEKVADKFLLTNCTVPVCRWCRTTKLIIKIAYERETTVPGIVKPEPAKLRPKVTRI